jgi:hypothetical protein
MRRHYNVKPNSFIPLKYHYLLFLRVMGWTAGVRVPAGSNFSLLHKAQISSWGILSLLWTEYNGFLREVKAAGV